MTVDEAPAGAAGLTVLLNGTVNRSVGLCESVCGHFAVLCRAVLCRASAGAAELAVLFNRLANVCEPKVMSVKGLNTAKVRT